MYFGNRFRNSLRVTPTPGPTTPRRRNTVFKVGEMLDSYQQKEKEMLDLARLMFMGVVKGVEMALRGLFRLAQRAIVTAKRLWETR